jgi:hypothetical protein
MSRELMDLESVPNATSTAISLLTTGGQTAFGLSETEILLDDDLDETGGETLIDGVDSFQLTYTRLDGDMWSHGTDTADTLGRIDIQLTLSRTDGIDPITFSTSVNPRKTGVENAPY